MTLFRFSVISVITTVSTWKITDHFLDDTLSDLPFLAKFYLKRALLGGHELTDEVLDATISLLIDNGYSAASPEITRVKFYAGRRCMNKGDTEGMKRWLLALNHVPHVGEGYSQELARKSMMKELEGKLLVDRGSSEKRGNEQFNRFTL